MKSILWALTTQFLMLLWFFLATWALFYLYSSPVFVNKIIKFVAFTITMWLPATTFVGILIFLKSKKIKEKKSE